jgi:thiopurine S-methyltransferase
VFGVELSNIAVESFFMENGLPARRETCQKYDEYFAPGLRLLRGNLFELPTQMLGHCAAIYDRASLIAMPPELQGRYVQKISELTPSGTETLLVTLEYPQHEMSGPPFSVDSVAINRLYTAHHKVRELCRTDILATDLKLGTRLSRLHEVSYHLTRL